jgi:hypothetical protein
MTNWLVTLINTIEPFDKKEEIVNAVTVQEALDKGESINDKYYARSARFYSVMTEHDYGIAYGVS